MPDTTVNPDIAVPNWLSVKSSVPRSLRDDAMEIGDKATPKFGIGCHFTQGVNQVTGFAGGILITSVAEGSPAAAANLAVGDRIIGIKTPTEEISFHENFPRAHLYRLRTIFGELSESSKVTLIFERKVNSEGIKKYEVEVTLKGAHPDYYYDAGYVKPEHVNADATPGSAPHAAPINLYFPINIGGKTLVPADIKLPQFLGSVSILEDRRLFGGLAGGNLGRLISGLQWQILQFENNKPKGQARSESINNKMVVDIDLIAPFLQTNCFEFDESSKQFKKSQIKGGTGIYMIGNQYLDPAKLSVSLPNSLEELVAMEVARFLSDPARGEYLPLLLIEPSGGSDNPSVSFGLRARTVYLRREDLLKAFAK